MHSPNCYAVQALFKDNMQYFSVNVPANDPVEAEAIVRLRSLRELLIAGVIRIPSLGAQSSLNADLHYH